MRISKKLASTIAVAAAVGTLGVTSVFADSRPAGETKAQSAEATIKQLESSGDGWRSDGSANRSSRADRRDDHRDDRRDRREGRREDRWDRRHDRREAFHHRGRISRVDRYDSGYRVWLGGARYPFFVPHSHFHRDRFRVGLVVRLGGYYNPRGYYDYYDGGYSRGELRGVVESVDYRRDTFVIRNESTGSFVTILNGDRRRDVRPGDYVEVVGDWSRRGVFRAYDVDLLDTYRGRW